MDFSTMLASVDFKNELAAIGSMAVALMAVLVATRGIRMILSFLSNRYENNNPIYDDLRELQEYSEKGRF